MESVNLAKQWFSDALYQVTHAASDDKWGETNVKKLKLAWQPESPQVNYVSQALLALTIINKQNKLTNYQEKGYFHTSFLYQTEKYNHTLSELDFLS